jgi:DNA sulfur modification protein DndD
VKFSWFRVENLFAYTGVSEINLTDTSSERNMIVVSGRNGAGKTSLLNAAKLLFLGSTDTTLRRVGFGGAPLTQRQFVLGQAGRWYGVFNAAARSTFASVSMAWVDGDREFEARRTFRLTKGGTDFDEDVLVIVDGVPMQPDDAASTLANLLPRETVPLFFFDGEQIQSLADAEIGREQTEIERLLGFSFFAELITHIDTYAREKARAGLPATVRVNVIAAENAATEARARAEAKGRERVQEEEARLDLERTRDRLSADRERLRSGTLTESERLRIENRMAVLEGEREEIALKIANRVPVELPFLANPALVGEAFSELDGHLGRATDNSIASRLHRELPGRVTKGLKSMMPPISLDDGQDVELRDLLRSTLEEFGVRTVVGNPLFQSLSPRRAADLRDRFLLWSQSGPATFAGQRGELLSMRRIAGELRQLRQELDEAELTTDEARARHVELTEQIRQIQADIEDGVKRITRHEIDEQNSLRQANEQEGLITDLERQYREVARQNAEYVLAIRTKQALERYRDLKRAEVRASVESRLNERVAILLAPSQLVRSVKLNDDFVMSYYDERGGEVARLSISAGMRQLLAMAMLWALKDEAGRPLPVIFDTPLGRIDRANRELLLDQYFPAAGQPLVILPTDSEFGPEIYGALGNRIRRRYRIENDGGDSACLVEIEDRT